MPNKKTRLGLIITLLGLISMMLAACGDATSTTAPATTASATTAAATTAAATTAVTTTVAATTAPATTAISTTVAATSSAATTGAATSASATSGATTSGEVIVFAAASLTDPFNEAKAELEKANPGLKITYNFNGSPTLRTQLEQGAKADLFVSADQTQIDNAQKSGLINDKGTIFARNRLVVIVPKSNPAKIEKLQDLAKSGVKFVTAQKDVPIGAYTLQALDKMSKDAAFGSDFSTKVQANFVSQESNVKQVVAKVQLGEADAAIVYITDVSAKVSPDITTIDIPDQFNTIAVYPISVLKAAPNPTGAKVFLDYILGEKGQALLKKYNFVPAVSKS
jgi:molybdate transport system substrate-binding protein